MDAKWIITVFVVIDDTMMALGHQSHYHARVSDAEILTVAVVAAKYFNNNHKLALSIFSQLGYLSGQGKLDPSRFNRRLHTLADWFELILETIAELFRGGEVFVMDSMPVPVCKWARRWRSKKLRGKEYCGKCVAKDEKFYGWRLHLITTPQGVPVSFSLVPARFHDLTPMHELTFGLAPGAKVFADKGYNCFAEEGTILSDTGVRLIPIRRKNMQNHTWEDRQNLRQYRKRIETANSQLERMGAERLFATTNPGFELKLQATLLALALTNY